MHRPRGARVRGLRVEWLNVLKGTLEVVASLWEGNGQHVIGPPKSGRRRALTIPRFLADMLGEHLAAYPSANGHVFTSTDCSVTGTSTIGTSSPR